MILRAERSRAALAVAAVIALALSIVVAPPAWAHTSSISDECGLLSVDLHFYSTGGDEEDTNSVTVTIDGEVVDEDTDFGASYDEEFELTEYEAHSWMVEVEAWDDPDGEKGWTFTDSGEIEPCEEPPTPPFVRVTFFCVTTTQGPIQNIADFGLDSPDFPAGVYVFRLREEAGVATDYTAGVGGSGLWSGSIGANETIFLYTDEPVAGVSVETSPVENAYGGTASTNETECSYPTTTTSTTSTSTTTTTEQPTTTTTEQETTTTDRNGGNGGDDDDDDNGNGNGTTTTPTEPTYDEAVSAEAVEGSSTTTTSEPEVKGVEVLPFTGANSGAFLGLAVSLLGVGLFLVLAAKGRHQT